MRAATRETLDPDERTRLITRLSAIREAMADVDRGIAVAYQQNPSLPATLPTQPADMAALRHSLDVTQRTLVEETAADSAHPEFATANQRAVVGTYQLFDEISRSLDRLLAAAHRRIQSKEVLGGSVRAPRPGDGGLCLLGLRPRTRGPPPDGAGSHLERTAQGRDPGVGAGLHHHDGPRRPRHGIQSGGGAHALVIDARMWWARNSGRSIVPPALREMHRRGLAQYRETGEGAVLRKRIEINAMHADGHEFIGRTGDHPDPNRRDDDVHRLPPRHH